MGRHRRSAAGRAEGAAQPGGPGARDHDPQAPDAGDVPRRGTAAHLNPEAYAEARARSDAYLFGTDDPAGTTVAASSGASPTEGSGPEDPADGGRRTGWWRRRSAGSAPVRTGLLGLSAAVALGAVAVTTGAVPGLDGLRIGRGAGGGETVRAAVSPGSTFSEQGGTSGSVDGGGTESAGSGTGRSASPSPSSPTPSASASSKTPSASPTPEKTTAGPEKPAAAAGEKTEAGPSRTATAEPETTQAPADRSAAVTRATAAEAEVLRLVNVERAGAGCTPVAASSALGELAEDFSEAMAALDFFDHTDPSGATPWDRAEAAGITNLGGENIARGQADAAAVMDAWMNSEGHRANILNCDFSTLGVGVQFGSGGPWWTQDFGY